MTRTIGRHGIRMGHGVFAGLLLACVFALPAPLAASEASEGAWQTKNQLVWDQDARALVRKSFRVFDPHPELGLEFTWEQRSGTAASGAPDEAVSGTGKLTWRTKGSAPYDRKAVYSEYDGEMRGGRPHGRGTLSVASGLHYEGAWRNGLMHGAGAIRFANGDAYDGTFADGVMDGSGRYAAVDGSVFEGAFRAGERHGEGTLTLPEGVSYRMSYERGVETRRLDATGAPVAETRVAQAGVRVILKTYIDRAKNSEFTREDPDFKSFVYEQENTSGAVRLRIAKPILDVWKGNGAIPQDLILFEDAGQFAPAFLVIEAVNEGTQAAQFTGGFLDVQQSVTDLQPLLTFVPPWDGCGEGKFDPEFELVNYGWGAVSGARASFGFGRAPADISNSADIGTFTDTKKANTLEGFRRARVNVDRLKAGGFKCRSEAQLAACTTQLVGSGIFGGIAGSVFRKEATLLVLVTGRLAYTWNDASGASRSRQSPFAVEIPLMTFDTGQGAECGAAGPVERDLKPVKLALDRKNYRVPISYRGSLAPRQTRRFAIAISAEKASQHNFRITLQLGDGTTVATPPVDLNYFVPRRPERADPTDVDVPGEPPTRN